MCQNFFFYFYIERYFNFFFYVIWNFHNSLNWFLNYSIDVNRFFNLNELCLFNGNFYFFNHVIRSFNISGNFDRFLYFLNFWNFYNYIIGNFNSFFDINIFGNLYLYFLNIFFINILCNRYLYYFVVYFFNSLFNHHIFRNNYFFNDLVGLNFGSFWFQNGSSNFFINIFVH